ncbi:MAG: hypothetical protein ABR562_07175, partial [Thermoplasmatota archaeon]
PRALAALGPLGVGESILAALGTFHRVSTEGVSPLHPRGRSLRSARLASVKASSLRSEPFTD